MNKNKQKQINCKHTISRLLKVHISVAQWPPGNHVPANPDGQDWASLRELLIEHSLSNIGMKITDVQRCHWVGRVLLVHNFLKETNRLSQIKLHVTGWFRWLIFNVKLYKFTDFLLIKNNMFFILFFIIYFLL